jgi:hypothetical protein
MILKGSEGKCLFDRWPKVTERSLGLSLGLSFRAVIDNV